MAAPARRPTWQQQGPAILTTLSLLLIFLAACDDASLSQSQTNLRQKPTTPGSTTPPMAVPPTSGTEPSVGTDPTDPKPESSSSQTSTQTSSDPSTGDPDTPTAGRRYFQETVLPLFNRDCASCHADPRMNPPQRGPLTIFSYDSMRELLTSGSSAADNGLSRKVRSVDPHGGGNQCLSGPTTSPCLEISTWWKIELESDTTYDAKITSVSNTGEVIGYAVDTSDTSKALTVRLVVDGQTAVETKASIDAPDGNYPGAHAFKAVLPDNVRDGKEHTLRVYVDTLALGTDVKFIAYAPKAAGRNYFDATVSPALTRSCANCHVIQYSIQFVDLLSPTPAKGGTAINNNLINTSAGSNQHPGGNICGSKNGSPCNLLQQWWNLEFGP